jgi:hypothetical protein
MLPIFAADVLVRDQKNIYIKTGEIHEISKFAASLWGGGGGRGGGSASISGKLQLISEPLPPSEIISWKDLEGNKRGGGGVGPAKEISDHKYTI